MKTIFVVLFLSVINVSYGQVAGNLLFQAGDQFVQQVAINSNSFIQQGNNTLPLSSNVHFTRSILVEDVALDAYVFLVNITGIIDTITYSGKRTTYSSDALIDSSSIVEKAIKNLLRQRTRIYVNRVGVVLAIDNELTEDQPDSLIRFMGILPASFETPGLFDFVRNRLDNKVLLKNSHLDTLALGSGKTVTRFSVDSKTTNTTTIRFSESFTGDAANINSNGAFTVDNRTGALIELATKTVSAENYLLNGISYGISRSTAKIEVFTKL